MASIRKALRAMTWAHVFVNVGVTVAVTIPLLLDIAARNIVGQALPSSYDFTEMVMLLITATGLIWLDAERDNIGFSIVVDRLSQRGQMRTEMLWRVALIPLFAFMAFSGFERMLSSFAANESRMGILGWPARLLVVLPPMTMVTIDTGRSADYIVDVVTAMLDSRPVAASGPLVVGMIELESV
ncbi:TRAP transporter small permease subunit [Rhodococcus sp. IEGM 1381]|uniref:TRAP transporter small permease n=1 Tax=Rhodococcus sp. IEGM 1381 TaxID=3047085 RepID=UPI0024B86F85|nr:TRAP transporter small permease subunit [Rhodococcus sp. IEGM 1381]MDI9897370.1 TRAP transporter small permease subunit [Rhodococcus sp. IEGM 1381]